MIPPNVTRIVLALAGVVATILALVTSNAMFAIFAAIAWAPSAVNAGLRWRAEDERAERSKGMLSGA